MPRKPPAALADRLRRHREAFTLALQLGITPAQAEQELSRRAAQSAAQAAQARLTARINGPLSARRHSGDTQSATPEPPPQPWWSRD